MFTLLLTFVLSLIVIGLLWKHAEEDRALELIGLLIMIVLLGVLTECTANAKDFKLLDVDSVSFSSSKFTCNREPMTPQYQCSDYTGRAAFDLNLRLLEVGYWDNHIHTEAVESTVKTVGWQFEGGIHVTPAIDLFYFHHSRHVMEDEQPATQRFPVEDSYGVRVKFYTNPNPSGSLIGG